MMPLPDLPTDAHTVFEISKGDGLFDLAELLLELLARPIGRTLGKTSPDLSQSPLQWGWADWLWLTIMVFIVVTLVRRHRRKKRESAAAESGVVGHD
jgi:hypothetical protein